MISLRASPRLAAAGLFFLLLLVLHPGQARAQNDAEAQRHFERAVALLQREDYASALREFEAARVVRETAAVVFNIAGCLRALSRAAEAVTAYERFLQVGRRPEQRAEAERAIAELAPRIARATVQVSVPGAALLLDGRPVLRQPVAVDVDALAVFEARLDGYRPARVAVRRRNSSPFEVVLRLERMRGGSGLSIQASVPGALVRIDGRDVGPAPWTGDVPAGSHEVVVHQLGYLDASETIVIEPGDLVRRTFRLVPSGGGSASGATSEASSGSVDVVAPTQQPAEPPIRDHYPSSSSPWPYIVGGAALIAGGLALTLVIVQDRTRELGGDVVVQGP